ncbi:hypothetical protein ABOONEI_808 [Aciduliprofundum boonei T469]|nr:hypothetical protein ABOONEI_808 [Aciduliprofundum boonei T469]
MVAVVILGVFYANGIKETKVIKVGSNSSESISINLTGNYSILISSPTNISYEFYAPNGTLLSQGNNTNAYSINITNANGQYELVIKNDENTDAEVAVLISEESLMNNLMYGIYASGGVCCLGMIIVVIAFVLLLWNRKMEEKQYKRY